MKTNIHLLEMKLQALSDKLFLLKNEPDVMVRMKYHREVILPLIEMLALAQSFEEKAGL